ncbi:MAG: hypothetical protein ACRD32_04315 [Nitrososphaerales archaeon]
MESEKKGKFELQFCSICGQSFETEYKLVKHLNMVHPEAISGGCCSDPHKHHEH